MILDRMSITCMYCILTVDVLLLLMGQNTSKVCPLETTFTLCCVPVTPMRKVFVAVALELVPAVAACFSVCEKACMNYCWCATHKLACRPWSWDNPVVASGEKRCFILSTVNFFLLVLTFGPTLWGCSYQYNKSNLFLFSGTLFKWEWFPTHTGPEGICYNSLSSSF